MNKPAFSNPDKSRLAVNPGVTPLEKAAARLVSFREPPEREGLEWADEHDERL